jgi:hypothetical protein
MAAKKSPSKKKTVTKAVGKKKVAKKEVAKKTSDQKKSASKKKVVKKAPAKKAAKTVAKKIEAPKKETPKKEAPKQETKKVVAQPAPVSKPKSVPQGTFLAAAVNLGHVFSLKPRVETSFRQADFRTAKLHLQDEGYETLEDAIRAVAEKALELTLGGGAGGNSKGKRR